MRGVLFALCLLAGPVAVAADVIDDKVEQLISSMTLEEKVGQVLIGRGYSNAEESVLEGHSDRPIDEMERFVLQQHVGGMILKCRWTPEKQNHVAQHLKSLSKTPLWIMQDLEHGLAMRHVDTRPLPQQLALGAIQDLSLLYAVGQEIGAQSRNVSVDINLAPVADLNTNPKNPIIHMRSLGDDPERVSEQVVQVMRGIASQGVMTCAKHYPGHGDTAQDSHVTLPTLSGDKERLCAVELKPFQSLIDAGVPIIMTAHVTVPQVDPGCCVTAASEPLIQILRDEMGFDGLIMTDALDMKALADLDMVKFAVDALKAGVDLLLGPEDLPRMAEGLVRSVESGDLPEEVLDQRVHHILEVKYRWRGRQPTGGRSLAGDALYRTAYREILTMARDPHRFQQNVSEIVYIDLGGENAYLADQVGAHGIPVRHLSSDPTALEIASVKKRLGFHKRVVIGVHPAPGLAKERRGVPESAVSLVETLEREGIACLVVLFTSPYAVTLLPDSTSVMVAYHDNEDAMEAVAQVLLEGLKPTGRMPVRL